MKKTLILVVPTVLLILVGLFYFPKSNDGKSWKGCNNFRNLSIGMPKNIVLNSLICQNARTESKNAALSSEEIVCGKVAVRGYNADLTVDFFDDTIRSMQVTFENYGDKRSKLVDDVFETLVRKYGAPTIGSLSSMRDSKNQGAGVGWLNNGVRFVSLMEGQLAIAYNSPGDSEQVQCHLAYLEGL